MQEMQEIWVQSLGQEVPQEKEPATWQPALVFLPGKSHGDFQEPGRLESMGSQIVEQE